METVTIEKLVNGGQGLATMADGKKVFVWNALPGETVSIRIIKDKKSHAEAIAEEILKPSADREEPAEENYLATSPWQIMSFEAENQAKVDIVKELFAGESVALPAFEGIVHDDQPWQYRNKMEYSFWGDDDGLHLALHQRGSHGKQVVEGSKLALPAVDETAQAVLEKLQDLNIRAGYLKTLIVRAAQDGSAVAALFVKPTKFPHLTLPEGVTGLKVYHSNPRSPASVPTKLLQDLGQGILVDRLLGQSLRYDVNSFFQVNIPVFEKALQVIKDKLAAPHITDMYAGVGSIGLSVAEEAVDLVELDVATAAMAEQNAAASRLETTVIQASSERTLDYISNDKPVIFDPPRAGLHDKVVTKTLEALPPVIAYLSCNPATQARDLAKLQVAYDIELFEIYNFFPRTPHIETLAILRRR